MDTAVDIHFQYILERRGWILGVFAAGLIALMAPGAAAEDRDPAPDPVPESAADRAIETMTVFGSSDGVRAAPGSGQYLGTEEVRDLDHDDIQRLLVRVPGVYVRPEDGNGLFPNISLRGVDTTRSAKVTLMEDGILASPAPYSAPAAYYSPSAGRMRGVEVLKGSSQIRYGPHTTGGVLNNLSTEVPADMALYLKGLYGTDQEARIHGYYGDSFDAGRAGTIGVLAEVYFRRSSGFKTIDPSPGSDPDQPTGFTTVEPMVKLIWEPATQHYQRFEVKLGYTRGDAQETYLGLSQADYAADPLRRYTTTRYDEIQRDHYRFVGSHFFSWERLGFLEQVDLGTQGYYSYFDRNWRKLEDILGVDIDGNGTIELGQTSELPRALAGDGTRVVGSLTPGTDGMPLEVLRGQRAGRISLRDNQRYYDLFGVQQGLQAITRTGPLTHELDMGWRFHEDAVRYFQRDELLDFAVDGSLSGYDPGTPGDAGNRYQQTQSLALYLEDAISIGAVTVVPGIRYEHLWQRYDVYLSNPDNVLVEGGTGTLDLLSGGVGLTWQVNDPLLLFTGLHTGVSPPNPQGSIQDGVHEERSIAAEAGARWERTDLGVRAEVTGFFTRFDDLIVIDNIGGAGSGRSENVGNVNSGGIETGISWDPGITWSLPVGLPTTLSYTWTNAVLASDADSLAPGSLFAGGKAGNRVPYIPEHALAVNTTLQWWRLELSAAVTYRSQVWATASNTDRFETPAGIPDIRLGSLPSQTLLDLGVGFWADRDERLKLVFGVHNLTDDLVPTTLHPIGPRPTRPRWIYGGLELSF